MARGWESKSVESQMESAEERRALQQAPARSAEEVKKLVERESLELSRTRIRGDLLKALNPRYRQQLEAALAHVEAKLAGL